MSGINGSVLIALEQIDPDEAQALEEQLENDEIYIVEAEEELVLEYDFE